MKKNYRIEKEYYSMKKDKFLESGFISSLCFFVIFFIFWFSILVSSGSLFSGYHFIDDHEIIRINYELAVCHSNIFQLSKKTIIQDFNMRFRPFYYFHRVLQTSILGTNFALWSIYTGLLAVCTSFFLYLFTRKLGFCYSESLILSVMPFLGKQSAIWWRLGPSETIGAFLLSLSLLFMGLSIYSKKKKLVYGIVFVIFTVLMSLCKESFILIIPAILFWKVWLHKDKNNIRLMDSVKNNKSCIVVLSLIVSLELFFIMSYVGTTKIGYAGVSGIYPSQYLKASIMLSRFSGVGIILFVAIILILLSNRYANKNRTSMLLGDLVYPGILFLLIVLPQIIFYAKSGIWERYLIPGILGYFLFIIYLLRTMRLGNIKSKKIANVVLVVAGISCIIIGILIGVSKEVDYLCLSLISIMKQEPLAPHWIETLQSMGKVAILMGTATTILVLFSTLRKRPSNFVYFLIMIGVFHSTQTSFIGALDFAREGRATNSFLESIQKNTKESSLILIVADPLHNYESGYSIKSYLNIVSKRNNLYLFPLLSILSCNDFEKGLIENFIKAWGANTSQNIADKSKIDCIAIFPNQENRFLTDSGNWFDSSKYRRSNSSGFVTYFRN